MSSTDRPVVADRVAWFDAGNAVVAWSPSGPPRLLTPVGAALASLLDGTVSRVDAAEDLVEADLTTVDDAGWALDGFLLRLEAAGLLRDNRAPGDLVDDLAAHPPPPLLLVEPQRYAAPIVGGQPTEPEPYDDAVVLAVGQASVTIAARDTALPDWLRRSPRVTTSSQPTDNGADLTLVGAPATGHLHLRTPRWSWVVDPGDTDADTDTDTDPLTEALVLALGRQLASTLDDPDIATVPAAAVLDPSGGGVLLPLLGALATPEATRAAARRGLRVLASDALPVTSEGTAVLAPDASAFRAWLQEPTTSDDLAAVLTPLTLDRVVVSAVRTALGIVPPELVPILRRERDGDRPWAFAPDRPVVPHHPTQLVDDLAVGAPTTTAPGAPTSLPPTIERSAEVAAFLRPWAQVLTAQSSRSAKVLPGRLLTDREVLALRLDPPGEAIGVVGRALRDSGVEPSTADALATAARAAGAVLVGYEAGDDGPLTAKLYLHEPDRSTWPALADALGPPAALDDDPPPFLAAKWKVGQPAIRLTAYRRGPSGTTDIRAAIVDAYGPDAPAWASALWSLAEISGRVPTARNHAAVGQGRDDHLDVRDDHGRRSVDLRAPVNDSGLDFEPSLSWLAEVAGLSEADRARFLDLVRTQPVDRLIGGTAGDTPFATLYLAPVVHVAHR